MFYHVHWDLIPNNVCDVVRTFLGGDDILAGFCYSVIMLIRMVTNAKHLSKFRPISLSKVSYKISSKVVADRLKVLQRTLCHNTRVPLFLDVYSLIML
jgi:hypothetical protein